MAIILIYLSMIIWPFNYINLIINHVDYEKKMKKGLKYKCAFISLELEI